MLKGKQIGLFKFKNRSHKVISISNQFRRTSNILQRVSLHLSCIALAKNILANHIPHEQYQQYNPPHTGDYNAPQPTAYQVSF